MKITPFHSLIGAVIPTIAASVAGLIDHKIDPTHAAIATTTILSLFGIHSQLESNNASEQVRHDDRLRAAAIASQAFKAQADRANAPTTVVATPTADILNQIEQNVLSQVLGSVEGKVHELLDQFLGNTLGDLINSLVEQKLQSIVNRAIGTAINNDLAAHVGHIADDHAAQLAQVADAAILNAPAPAPTPDQTTVSEPNGEA